MTTLLYRGSNDGWKLKDFHFRCSNKGPTLSLFKVKKGDCIGGFTSAYWTSPMGLPGKYYSDSDALLFNLSCCRVFPSKQTGNEIYCGSIRGPCFMGNSGSELSALHEPFNGDQNCYSYANQPGYGIPTDSDGINLLTNRPDGEFTISELEVWEVQFI